MSLQVWLPLNGNLNNLGLSSNIITSTYYTENANGKIGKCIKTTATGKIGLGYSSKQCNTGSLSFCGWFKINKADIWATISSLNYTSTNNNVCCNIIGNNSYGGIGLLLKSNNIYQDGTLTQLSVFSCIRTSTLSYVATSAYTVPFDTWVHIGLVYNKTENKHYLYINGALYTSLTIATFSDMVDREIAINYAGIAGGNGFGRNIPMLVNDIRIYDHALSEKEVQEIAKGLVVHYKLDNGNPNLIDPEYYNVAPWNNAITGREYDNEYGNILLVRNSTLYTASSSGTTALFPITFIENTQYTISVDWRDDLRTDGKNSSLYLRFDYTDGSTRSSIISPASSKTYWTHSKLTSNANKTVSKITTIYGNSGIVKIANLKIEIGTQETRYVGDNYTVYDCSGYQNNATNINCMASNDTPKYDKSIAQQSGQYIRSLDRPNDFLPHDAITVNLWMKCTTWGNPISCTKGGGFNFEYAGGGIRFPIHITHSSGNSYAVAQSTITPNTLLNDWHMLTGTFDGTNTIMYIDGEEVGRTTAYSGTIHYYNNYLFIGAEALGDNTTPANSTFVGNISDVRIYTTALSAAAIKDLYETSAEIDKNGNFYIGSINETTNISITKTNIVNANDYIEGTSIAELTSDADWNINHVYEI